jgi:hypothetical protein
MLIDRNAHYDMNRDNNHETNHETNHHTPISHQSPTDDDWSLNKCMAIHDANDAMRKAETAAQIRAFRDEEQTRYRETQYRDFYNKKVLDPTSSVSDGEREFYRKLGQGKVEFKSDICMTRIIMTILVLFFLFLVFR